MRVGNADPAFIVIGPRVLCGWCGAMADGSEFPDCCPSMIAWKYRIAAQCAPLEGPVEEDPGGTHKALRWERVCARWAAKGAPSPPVVPD